MLNAGVPLVDRSPCVALLQLHVNVRCFFKKLSLRHDPPGKLRQTPFCLLCRGRIEFCFFQIHFKLSKVCVLKHSLLSTNVRPHGFRAECHKSACLHMPGHNGPWFRFRSLQGSRLYWNEFVHILLGPRNLCKDVIIYYISKLKHETNPTAQKSTVSSKTNRGLRYFDTFIYLFKLSS